MIDVTNNELYDAALRQLSLYRQSFSGNHKGRFIQLFLALKFYQNNLPSMFSGSFITTEVLQTMLDDLYAKANRPLNNCVLSLFTNNYLARTGLIAPGNTYPANNWRNNFNLQKGIGCYAPQNDLASQTFLNQDRIYCRYLVVYEPGSLAGGHCSLCSTGARYRNEDHRKWLRIDVGGNGYAVVDLNNVSNFLPYVAPQGQRIPIVPLIIALYHDASPDLFLGTRQNVDLDVFQDDFNFSKDEFISYFDDDPNNVYNTVIRTDSPSTSYNQISTALPSPQQIVRPSPPTVQRPPRPIRNPVLSGTPAPPPAANTGWDAEQFVKSTLLLDHWEVHDVSRQQLGYDLLAKKGGSTRYFEVKSSVGSCNPTLTSKEWQQAHVHGVSYVLAIIENFNAEQQNTVYWIPDPANSCSSRQAQTIMYSIPRNSWITATVSITEL